MTPESRSQLLNARAVTARLLDRGRHFRLVAAPTLEPETCVLNPPVTSTSLPPGVAFELRPPHISREDCATINEAVHLEWLKGRGASWDSGCPELRFCRKHCSFQICIADMTSPHATSSALITESGLAAALDTIEGAALDECVSRHLTEGGDDRLHLSAAGVNKYYCPPRPLPSQVVIRGSCTCSSPTPDGFEAARKTLRTLWSGRQRFGDCMQDVARRLSRALQITAPHEVILHPSGSDAELIPLAVAAACAERLGCAAIVNIVVAAGEVGSGTAPASGGRHFSEFVPNGGNVSNGGVVDGFPISTSVVEIKPRANCGSRIDKYDDMVRDACVKAQKELGDPFIVLHAVDGSKTGMRVPSKGLLLEMNAKLGKRLLVVMDACQCRSEAEEIDWFLRCGAVVLVTASKFYSAPGFCGAVLVPKDAAAVLNEWENMPSGLGDYLTQYEIPMSMYGMRRKMPQDKKNIGLLLRWACGIAEMELFVAQGQAVRYAIREWVVGVRALVQARKPLLELICDPYENEHGDSTRLGGVNSVVSIKFMSACGTRHLDAAVLRNLHRMLTIDASKMLPASASSREREVAALQCTVGQPVKLGDYGVLRLAIGAPLARYIATNGVKSTLEKDDLILDKMILLASYCDELLN